MLPSLLAISTICFFGILLPTRCVDWKTLASSNLKRDLFWITHEGSFCTEWPLMKICASITSCNNCRMLHKFIFSTRLQDVCNLWPDLQFWSSRQSGRLIVPPFSLIPTLAAYIWCTILQKIVEFSHCLSWRVLCFKFLHWRFMKYKNSFNVCNFSHLQTLICKSNVSKKIFGLIYNLQDVLLCEKRLQIGW